MIMPIPGAACDAIRGQWSAFEGRGSCARSPSALAVAARLHPRRQGRDAAARQPAAVPVSYNDPAAVAANAKRGVLVQAWSPLAAAAPPSARQACAEVGGEVRRAQQVALRWIVQSGAAFPTQTKKREHFKEDLELFDLSSAPTR